MRKMLTPHVRAIGRPAGAAQDDAVDPGRAGGTPAALKGDLSRAGFVTRDAREVERKKVGRRKARRGPQYSKR